MCIRDREYESWNTQKKIVHFSGAHVSLIAHSMRHHAPFDIHNILYRPCSLPPICAVCRPTYPSYTSRHVSLALAPVFSLLLAQSTTSSLVLCGALNGRKILLHFCTIWMKWIDRVECLVCLPLWMYVPFDSPRYLRCVSLWIHIVIRWDSSASLPSRDLSDNK